MTGTDVSALAPTPTARAATGAAGRTPVDWRRMRSPVAAGCVLASLVGAIGMSVGSVLAGRLAEQASSGLVVLLALCLVGAAVVDSVGRTVWAGAVDRAEGLLRADLLDAAISQPLPELGEQAVGEVLDRVDDDTHEVGLLLRQHVWQAIRTLLAAGPLWLVAGLTWWPAFALFPLAGLLAIGSVRTILPALSRRKVVEEMSWTDHAAAMEEGIAARDDLRTSLGQAYVTRRCSELAASVHARFDEVLELESRVIRRAGTLLHAALAAIAVAGIALALGERISTAGLVTLFLVTTMFVGQVNELAQHLPDLQAGFGAVLRLRGLLAVEPEPAGGRALPPGPLTLQLEDLHFSYGTGSFALSDVDLTVPAGSTCALVGRTGSGKSTLASLVSRAVEPPPGSVRLGGVDVLDLDLQALRAGVGVVTQQTEILAGTLAENVALFGAHPHEAVRAAVADLGLTGWVAGLPDGLDTLLGPGGTSLSAGEEQLVAFARLLVRDVRVVVLDEATARMDPVTEGRVVTAAERLLRGRTGLLVAHRLGTTARADHVAVLEGGRVVQQGPRATLLAEHGPFRDLHDAAGPAGPAEPRRDVPEAPEEPEAPEALGSPRRAGARPPEAALAPTPGLARATLRALLIEPRWGLVGAGLFVGAALTGAFGALTGWVWGLIVEELGRGGRPLGLTGLLVVSLVASPLVLALAFRLYPRWWIAVMLRVRAAVLHGQTNQRRLRRTPPGEAVARAMDAERLARYADRWVDLSIGLVVAVVTAAAAWNLVAGAVLLAVMGASALASTLGRPVAGRSAAAASDARARFGRSLVSALESVRTVKLAAATPAVHRHLRGVDAERVQAAVREHRVQALLDGVPVVMVQAGVVAAWAGYASGGWGLATALLVANAVNGFDWFGRVAGSVITEAPGTTAWMGVTSRLAGGGDLMDLPRGVDLVSGGAPAPAPAARDPLRELRLVGLSAVHDDGTVGVRDVDLVVRRGELVLLLGRVGAGKSTLLGALAGLVSSRGEIRWNDEVLADPETALRPGRVAHVAQVPRVLSGTFAGNVHLDHPGRPVEEALATARLGRDVAEAGGPEAAVGHRGVRLSGGQVQRLGLARALACRPALLLADDVSSALDAATEIELWRSLREQGTTVLGATSKTAALARADRVVVLADGRVVDEGPWSALSATWAHLAG